jgi:hypothetical protein
MESEFINLLVKEIEYVLDKEIEHARFCKEHNLEWEDITITWIDKHSSPFPNQDRKWKHIRIYKRK